MERLGETAAERVATLGGRQESARASLIRATEGPDQFEARRNALFSELEAAENRRKTAADSLAEAESTLKAAEDSARMAENLHAKARVIYGKALRLTKDPSLQSMLKQTILASRAQSKFAKQR